MADKSTAKVQQTTREVADTAKETAAQADAARRVSESASRGYGEFWDISRDNMEGMAKASRAKLKGTSDLGSLWASFWTEQLTTGVEAMPSLAETDSSDEALKARSEFTRSSLDRVCSRALKSAEVTAQMLRAVSYPYRSPHEELGARAAAGCVVLRGSVAVQWRSGSRRGPPRCVSPIEIAARLHLCGTNVASGITYAG